ncbi:MAG: Tim44/TimA family putative adaptor protein [Rhodovibrionaceae bacterium]|nr:Tim44/TimA family putative adaptor protein [Rhodovibrionaceae bacterium]
MNGFPFVDVIIFAAIAAFLVLRLRGVLGRRTGHEQKMEDMFKREGRQEDGEQDTVVQMPDRRRESEQGGDDKAAQEVDESGDPVRAGLTQIRLADSSFDPDGFLQGARAAFEMVVDAYARGDSKTLRPLLANDVFQDFDGAIKEREKNKQSLETTLVGIESADIVEAELQGKTAFITVKFVSEQVNVLRDAKGEVVEGDPNEVAKITDIWTFARNTRSRDPNWTLVATNAAN